MPIVHTRITPPDSLYFELGRLKIIAALAHVIGLMDLKEATIQAHDKIVVSYNNSLPKIKPKGFWGKFIDNLTFQDLNTTCVIELNKLRNSQELQDSINLYSNFSQEENIDSLNKILNE